jgi:hypothetical protein
MTSEITTPPRKARRTTKRGQQNGSLPAFAAAALIGHWSDRPPAIVLECLYAYMEKASELHRESPELSADEVDLIAAKALREQFGGKISETDRQWVKHQLPGWLGDVPAD